MEMGIHLLDDAEGMRFDRNKLPHVGMKILFVSRCFGNKFEKWREGIKVGAAYAHTFSL